MKGNVMSPEDTVESLSLYLGEDGDIKGEAEAENLANYLKQGSHETVAQCMLMNIIRATSKHTVLSKFLTAGGWGLLRDWLVKCSDENDFSLLQELLQVYKSLPVDTSLLRANDAPKVIKSLRRSSDRNVKSLADETTSQWMQLVREQTKASSKSSSSSSGKASKKDMSQLEMDNSTSKVTGGSKFEKERSNTNEAKLNEPENAISEEISNISISAATTKERAKTVKLVNSKFRSTGLEETVVKPASKKSLATAPSKSTVTSAGAKRPTPVNEEAPTVEKRAKFLATLPDAEATRNKMQPPKPKSLSESTGFMDALMLPAVPVIKKKRKPSLTSSTSPLAPPLPPALSAGSSGALVRLEAGAQLPPSSTASPAVASSPSSVPASPPIIVAPPSFYRDTLESPTAAAAPAMLGGLQPLASEDQQQRTTVPNCGQRSPTAIAEESASETASVASESSQSQIGGKKKKQVSWAAESELRKIFLFDLDENERVNVNRLKAEGTSTFDEMKKMEMRRDREVLMHGHAISLAGRDSVIVKMEWFQPPPVDDVVARVEPGYKSVEKAVQAQRESKSLQALYFQKEKIPPSADEADMKMNENPEPSLRTEPAIIPLELVGLVSNVSHQLDGPMDVSAPSLHEVVLPDSLRALFAPARGRTRAALPDDGSAQPMGFDQFTQNVSTVLENAQMPQHLPPYDHYYDGDGSAMDHDGLLGSGGLLGTGGLLGSGSLLGAGGLLGGSSFRGVGGPPPHQQGHVNGVTDQPSGVPQHYGGRPPRGGGESGMHLPPRSLLPSPPPPPMDYEPLGPVPGRPLLRAPPPVGPPPPHSMQHGMPRGPGPIRGPSPGGYRMQGGKPVVCRHFIGRGGCKFGMKCQFFHPGVHQ